MTFALGLVTAGLLALIAAPAFWRRAMRLSRRRLELQLPLSTSEILAERDQVRAEAALAARRAEQRVEAAQAAKTQAMVELGRRAVALAELGAERDRLSGALTEASAAAAGAAAAAQAAQAEAGALAQALASVETLRERGAAAFDDLERRHERLSELSETRRATIAGLETRVEALEMRLASTIQSLAETREGLAARTREAAALTEQRDFMAQELARSEAHLDKLQARYAAQVEKLAALESELSETRARARRVEIEAGHKREAMTAQSERLAEVEARIAELRRKQDETVAAGRARERELIERFETLRAEKAALDGALSAARSERDGLRAESARRRAGAPQSEEDLRSLITRIADEVVQRAATAEGPGSPAHDWLAAMRAPRRQRSAGRHGARPPRPARLEEGKSDPATGA